MKNKTLLSFFSLFIVNFLFAQTSTNENFESATNGSTSFTSNSQTFNITTQSPSNAPQGFRIDGSYPGTGWNGSATDNKYIDNDGAGNSQGGVPIQFTISSSGGVNFRLTSMYIYLANNNNVLQSTGTLTIVGKLSGSTVFTVTQTNGFNTNLSTNNGFTFVDMSTFGGSNNSTVNIDQFVISTTSGINYVALDALTWVTGFTTWNGTTWSNSSPSSSLVNGVIASSSAPSNFTCRALTINSGVSLNTTGITANINGNIVNNGNGISGTGTLNIAANSSISGNNLALTGTLTVASGATLTTNGLLTLKSTSVANTAEVGVVSGTISGNVTVERFIPAKRAYRFLTPGVNTTTSINANWQEGTNNPNTSTNNNPNAGYGTHITGGTSGNGFDVTGSNNPSLFTFNSGTQAWTAIANTNATTLSATTGYRIIIRGDRSVSLNTNTPTATNTTLRATGTLTTGTVNFTGISGTTNNYTLLGNPYWAGVDWTSVTRTNLSNTYWIWDPTIAGTNGRGGYTSFTRTGVGTGTTSGGGNINKNIQPGQAFFVQTTGASPALTFAEANKDVVTAFTNTFRTQQNNTSGTNGLYVVRLFLQENYTQGLMADAATLAFSSQFSNSKDEFDAAKLENPDESIGFKNGKDFFGMESRALPTSIDTAYIQLGNMLSKNYVLEVEGKDFDANSTISAYLVDNYLHTQTLLKNTGSVQVPYVIDNNAASAASNRFIIVTSKKAFPSLVSSGDVNIKVSPNPSTDVAVISYSAKTKGATTIRVINSFGQVVTSLNLGEQQIGQYSLPVSKLAAGQYVVEVTVGEEKTTSQFVKQ